ncbi:UTP--glucose-1-phosphate uridylyltransferase [Actinomyces minihominis]|uniref:UTP--glucose-1-phosphate uridylyltransferase n=1 Tax=Actinomyces minihominis TaxID=2002838 RepID=UPI000C06FD0C|nr:UTP--glucose-1-phosphate uridylyltransferase [Actinomyces minihominis]
MTAESLRRAQQKMTNAGVAAEAIEVFSHYFSLLEAGEAGLIQEESIEPYVDPASSTDLHYPFSAQAEALAKTALIKLNGGLGTSMGLDRAKTLLPVAEGQTFLDLIAKQTLYARSRFDARLPLVFMNSYRTDHDTLRYLSRYADLAIDGIPLSFLQSKEPRLDASTLEPVSWPSDPEAEWCPPGHGDLYVSLLTSGLLDLLIREGFEFAQVSNGDNLGATPDPDLAAWFADTGAAFAMEICRRTPNDRKGGHLARRIADGALVLRESAQTDPEDIATFEDIDRHRYFNTNTIWLNLPALKAALQERSSVLGLPMIRNTKTVDVTDPNSPQVIQVETAMGSAIEVFENATAIEVPRSRFLPVKTTNELLLLRSDLYVISEDGSLRATTTSTPEITLNKRDYGHINDFEALIPQAPSLRDATSLQVLGKWRFEPGARVTGDVVLGPEGGVVLPD